MRKTSARQGADLEAWPGSTVFRRTHVTWQFVPERRRPPNRRAGEAVRADADAVGYCAPSPTRGAPNASLGRSTRPASSGEDRNEPARFDLIELNEASACAGQRTRVPSDPSRANTWPRFALGANPNKLNVNGARSHWPSGRTTERTVLTLLKELDAACDRPATLCVAEARARCCGSGDDAQNTARRAQRG